ncbi:MAG: chemotaxis protein CheW [Gemmatimonadota bacterium]|nr:chemotaxis protein CheW [Gemmatimonadota bacterium]
MSAILAHAAPAESPMEALVFRLGDERFALALTAVDEVVECAWPQAVPSAAAPMLGVVALGGALLAAYSPHEVLGISRAEVVGVPAIAILLRRGDHRIALLVDELLDVMVFHRSALRPVSLDGAEARLVTGVISRDGQIVALLDAESLVGACLDRHLPEAS